MFVSIIIPTFNSSKLAPCLIENISCISSIIDVEFLFIDDCSIDETYEILQKLFEDYSNVKVYKTVKNSGPGVARNIGMKHACGKYILFMDADDKLDFVNTICSIREYKILRDIPPIDVISFMVRNESRYIPPLISLEIPIYYEDHIRRICVFDLTYEAFPAVECWGMMFSTKFLRSNNITFPNIKIAEDQVFMTEVRIKMKTIGYTDFFSYVHTANSTGLATTFTRNAMDCYRQSIVLISSHKTLKCKHTLKFLDLKIQGLLYIYFWFLIAFYEEKYFIDI
jgi:glycosyltransferase involved in cell wall biosynthesis